MSSEDDRPVREILLADRAYFEEQTTKTLDSLSRLRAGMEGSGPEIDEAIEFLDGRLVEVAAITDDLDRCIELVWEAEQRNGIVIAGDRSAGLLVEHLSVVDHARFTAAWSRAKGTAQNWRAAWLTVPVVRS